MREYVRLQRLRCASPPVIHDVVPAGLRIKTYPCYYQHKNVKKTRGKKTKIPLIYYNTLITLPQHFRRLYNNTIANIRPFL
jgi:hypothetical protein